jgi:hypothetical protein
MRQASKGDVGFIKVITLALGMQDIFYPPYLCSFGRQDLATRPAHPRAAICMNAPLSQQGGLLWY